MVAICVKNKTEEFVVFFHFCDDYLYMIDNGIDILFKLNMPITIMYLLMRTMG